MKQDEKKSVDEPVLDVEREAFDENVWQDFYLQLKRLAGSKLANWRGGSTISATVLVHEVFLKLNVSRDQMFRDKGHFLAVASLAMRQVIVEYLRQKSAKKREHFSVTIDDFQMGDTSRALDYLTLDRALKQLESVDKRMVQVAEASIFGGFTFEEIAEAMGLSRRTVNRLWTKAKIMLIRVLQMAESD